MGSNSGLGLGSGSGSDLGLGSSSDSSLGLDSIVGSGEAHDWPYANQTSSLRLTPQTTLTARGKKVPGTFFPRASHLSPKPSVKPPLTRLASPRNQGPLESASARGRSGRCQAHANSCLAPLSSFRSLDLAFRSLSGACQWRFDGGPCAVVGKNGARVTPRRPNNAFVSRHLAENLLRVTENRASSVTREEFLARRVLGGVT